MVLNWIHETRRQPGWWRDGGREATFMAVSYSSLWLVSGGLTHPHWAELQQLFLSVLGALHTWLGIALATWPNTQLAWHWESKSRPALAFSPPREGELWLSLLTYPLPAPQFLRPFCWNSSLLWCLLYLTQKQLAQKLRTCRTCIPLYLAPALTALPVVTGNHKWQSVMSPQHTVYLALLCWAWWSLVTMELMTCLP